MQMTDQDVPPKTVKFPVYNMDTDEFETLEMDEQDFKDMCDAEEEENRKRDERTQRALDEERKAYLYVRDDD